MTSALTAAGVDAFDETVYRAILIRNTADVDTMTAATGAAPDAVAAALARLSEQGLVVRMSGADQQRYAAIDPEAALGALVRSRAAELDRVQIAARELANLFAHATSNGTGEIEVLTGSDALGAWFVRIQQEARTEVITLDRPPYALSTDNPVEQTALARGVTYRAVYAPEALAWPGVLDDIRELVRHGEQARILSGIRVKVAIADRKIAVMPLSLDMKSVRAVVIRPSTLLDALIDYWEQCWAHALPIDAPADDPLTDDDRALLTLLVAGLKDEAIARQLGWSVRTMRRRISRLHELLNAETRFQAGVAAARSGLI